MTFFEEGGGEGGGLKKGKGGRVVGGEWGVRGVFGGPVWVT